MSRPGRRRPTRSQQRAESQRRAEQVAAELAGAPSGRRRSRRARRDARRAASAAQPPHVRRRRRLLRWSWLPAAVLLGLGVHLLVLLPVYGQGRAAWDAGDDRTAQDVFDRQRSVVPVEQWKADFNAGTAHARAQWWSSALDALEQALVGVPDAHRCAVQTNRAVVLEAYAAETEEYAAEALADAELVRVAEAARAAGEPYDEEVLEPPYDGADPPTYADELRFAQYLLERAADQAALRAEALADPACAPPPSGGGGGGGGGGDDRADQQQAAQQQLEELSERAQEVGSAAQAAQQGRPQDAPSPGAGDGEERAPTPEEVEAERQAQVAERNRQANGTGGGDDQGDGQGAGGGDGEDGTPGEPGGGSPGSGTEPGQGGGAPGGRRW